MIKIVLTGPESTGKSTLAKQLANRFEAAFVEEYARQFIDDLDRSYVESDLLEIAKWQLEQENLKIQQTKKLLICDTDLLTIKIWSEYKFQRCNSQILKWIEERDYDHYLLCGTDVEWQFDPQRENPNERKELYDIYKKELNFYKKQFTEIVGNEEQRLQVATELIYSFLKK
jgi:NadR type nicotinamide-nucleotide adenylyltransferase